MYLVILGIVLGVLGAIFVPWIITPGYSVYFAVGILAALDSVFGGIYASMNKKFNMAIFVSGLICNALLACAIILLGEKLGLDLYMAIVVVFGTRLFNNFSSIRHHIILNYALKKKEKTPELSEIEEKTEENQ